MEVTQAWQKVTAAYCRVYGMIHFTSPVGWLPVHRDQLRAQCSVTSMGKLYLFYLYYIVKQRHYKLKSDTIKITSDICMDVTLGSLNLTMHNAIKWCHSNDTAVKEATATACGDRWIKQFWSTAGIHHCLIMDKWSKNIEKCCKLPSLKSLYTL